MIILHAATTPYSNGLGKGEEDVLAEVSNAVLGDTFNTVDDDMLFGVAKVE